MKMVESTSGIYSVGLGKYADLLLNLNGVNKRVVDQTAFYIFIFFLALGLFIGTFAVVPSGNLRWAFLHLFGSWAFVIAVLFLSSRFIDDKEDDV